MLRNSYTILLAVVLSTTGVACASDPNQPAASPPAAAPLSQLDGILTTLNKNLAALHSCRLDLTWTFTQPLLETSTVRRGVLYYRKGSDRSQLRIHFDSFQQDKEKPQSMREEIIFDGVWLTRIDYQLKEIKRDQLARDDKPIQAFQLLTGRIPLIGFGSVEDLKKQFDITLVEPNTPVSGRLVHLLLKTRPNSDYRNDYRTIDIFTEPSAAMPDRIRAVTPDDDISEISLTAAGPQDVPDLIFAFERPRSFTIISKPLKADEK
jgi:hypothetical protein